MAFDSNNIETGEAGACNQRPQKCNFVTSALRSIDWIDLNDSEKNLQPLNEVRFDFVEPSIFYPIIRYFKFIFNGQLKL